MIKSLNNEMKEIYARINDSINNIFPLAQVPRQIYNQLNSIFFTDSAMPTILIGYYKIENKNENMILKWLKFANVEKLQEFRLDKVKCKYINLKKRHRR